MLKVIKLLIIIFIAQHTVAVAGENLSDFSGQDTIKRVSVKMSAREISVDYGKLFKEASPVEAKPAVAYTVKKKQAKKGIIAHNNVAPVVAIVKKPLAKPMTPKIAVAKASSPAVPIVKAQATIASASKKSVARKSALAISKPHAVKAAPAQVKKEITVQKPLLAKIEEPVQTSSVPVVVDEDGTKPLDSPEFKKFKKTIESEQSQWDSLANAQLNVNGGQPEDGVAGSKMSYLYIGLAITLAGVVFGLFLGRPAFLLSVVGVVFVLIGLFIRP